MNKVNLNAKAKYSNVDLREVKSGFENPTKCEDD